MITLKSHGFIVECEHCLHLCSTEEGEEGFVTVEDTVNDKLYRLEFKVKRKDDKKIHVPQRLRDMDKGAKNVLPELSGKLRQRYEGLVEDMNDPGAGHQESCPRAVKEL